MGARKQDRIVIQTEQGGFERFSSVSLTHDLYDTSSATFEIGGDEAWQALETIIQPGQEFRVMLNGRLQMTGRAEVNEAPVTTSDGATVSLVCRTKMADARYASADPKLRFKDQSIKTFVLAAYAPLGYKEADFAFAAYADVDLVTGRAKGSPAPVDLAPIKADSLKVAPPETIFECVGRVLKRHHLMHWDGADGRILVGRPATDLPPIYHFQAIRLNGGEGNNVLSCKRIVDWSEVASEVSVHGSTPGVDIAKSAFRGVAVDQDLFAVAARTGHFARRVIIPADGVKSQKTADAQATRELAARAKRKSAWEFEIDGWSWWDGHDSVPFAINAMADCRVDVIGGAANGRFLVTTMTRTVSVEQGATTKLVVVDPANLEI
jgi:prophage tail gpP-like protein